MEFSDDNKVYIKDNGASVRNTSAQTPKAPKAFLSPQEAPISEYSVSPQKVR